MGGRVSGHGGAAGSKPVKKKGCDASKSWRCEKKRKEETTHEGVWDKIGVHVVMEGWRPEARFFIVENPNWLKFTPLAMAASLLTAIIITPVCHRTPPSPLHHTTAPYRSQLAGDTSRRRRRRHPSRGLSHFVLTHAPNAERLSPRCNATGNSGATSNLDGEGYAAFTLPLLRHDPNGLCSGIQSHRRQCLDHRS